jgi:hypothetical protein
MKRLVAIFSLSLAAGSLMVTGTARSQATWSDEFTFVRLKYRTPGRVDLWFRSRYGQESWTVDYPTAEENFIRGLRRATSIKVSENAIFLAITDPRLFEYPFAYVVEVGFMSLSQEEADVLREWLLRGGFLMVDDFHGTREWNNFVMQMRKVFPDREIRDLPSSHPIFHSFYDFDTYPQVPGLGSILYGRTWEKGGRIPHSRGVFDDQDRLMVLINHNTDLGDSWEHAADSRYPTAYSVLGYKLGINYVIYALTH